MADIKLECANEYLIRSFIQISAMVAAETTLVYFIPKSIIIFFSKQILIEIAFEIVSIMIQSLIFWDENSIFVSDPQRQNKEICIA